MRFALLIACTAALSLSAVGATVCVRPASAVTASPASLIATHDLGDTYCYPTHCIVRSNTAAQKAALTALATDGLITVEALPEADLLFFANATYDVTTSAFDRQFPGFDEAITPSAVGSFVVVFKSYPEQVWLDSLRAKGLAVLAPLSTMGYFVYGDRTLIESLPRTLPYIVTTLELPPGIKRFNLDNPGTDALIDAPGATTFTIPTAAEEAVRALFANWATPPTIVSSPGPTATITATLTRADAKALSRLPEILSIRRQVAGAPSDERANRIIGGQYQTPNTSWPTTALPTNSTPYYWGHYLDLSNLNLNNQTIGFMDTGVSRGLQDNGNTVCPPHLTPNSGPCRLIFTADAFTTVANDKADDIWGHGTLVTSIAAGLAGDLAPYSGLTRFGDSGLKF